MEVSGVVRHQLPGNKIQRPAGGIELHCVGIELFHGCSQQAVSAGSAFHGGERTYLAQAAFGIWFLGSNRSLAADGAAKIEGAKGFVILPDLPCPCPPLLHLGDIAPCIGVQRGELESKVIFGELYR